VISAVAAHVAERAEIVATASAVTARRSWCVIEVCVDVPRQQWEPRLLVCQSDPGAVADAVEDWVGTDPSCDVRLGALTRTGLQPDPQSPDLLCHLA
jgi:hypothetical protein